MRMSFVFHTFIKQMILLGLLRNSMFRFATCNNVVQVNALQVSKSSICSFHFYHCTPDPAGTRSRQPIAVQTNGFYTDCGCHRGRALNRGRYRCYRHASERELSHMFEYVCVCVDLIDKCNWLMRSIRGMEVNTTGVPRRGRKYGTHLSCFIVHRNT